MKKQLPYCNTSEAIIGYQDSQLAKSERNDCVVRALASAYEIPYERAHEIVQNKFKRKSRKGTYGFNSKMNTIAQTGEPINGKRIKIIGQKGIVGYSLSYEVKVKGNVQKRNMTVGTFSKMYPNGVFIMSVRGHAFTIKDGVVVGNKNDSTKLKVIVKQAWEII